MQTKYREHGENKHDFRSQLHDGFESYKIVNEDKAKRYGDIKHKAKVVATKRSHNVRDKIEQILEERELKRIYGGDYGYDG